MICRHCGADHGDGARYCPSTGRPVAPPAPDDEPEPEPTRMMEALPFAEAPAPEPSSAGTQAAVPRAAPAGPRDPPAAGPEAVIRDAIAMWQRHFVPFLIIAAIGLAPIAIVKAVILWILQAVVVAAAASAVAGGLAAAIAGWLAAVVSALAVAVASVLVLSLAVPLTQAATLAGLADAGRGREVSWSDAWSAALRRAGPLILTQLLVTAVVLVGSLLLVVPGVLAAFFLTFTAAVTMLENRSGVDAMRRSFDLVRADWVNVLVVVIALVVAHVVVAVLTGLVVPRTSPFLGSILGDLLLIALLPFPVIASAYAYLEARRKLDGEERRRLDAEWGRVGG